MDIFGSGQATNAKYLCICYVLSGFDGGNNNNNTFATNITVNTSMK